MRLFEHQVAFANDFRELLNFINSLGLDYVHGEVLRTPYQQRRYIKIGKSKTFNSMHLKKCAADLFILNYDGDIMYSHVDPLIIQISDYWKSLNPLNRWGGDFKAFDDSVHFERHVSI